MSEKYIIVSRDKDIKSYVENYFLGAENGNASFNVKWTQDMGSAISLDKEEATGVGSILAACYPERRVGYRLVHTQHMLKYALQTESLGMYIKERVWVEKQQSYSYSVTENLAEARLWSKVELFQSFGLLEDIITGFVKVLEVDLTVKGHQVDDLDAFLKGDSSC